MPIDFNLLPDPEPSSLVGFSRNRLVRDAENRDEETLGKAMADPATRYYLFSGNRVILSKTDQVRVLFSNTEAEQLGPRFDDAILLGIGEDGPQVALPLEDIWEEAREPWDIYDLRSLLYSGSVGEEDAGAIAQAGSMLHWNAMNRHCGRCGSPTESRIGGYRRDCPACDAKFFPRTDPVVIMLTVSGDKCLMGRSPHFPEGWYSTLAGFVEPGETMEDAMRRETFEESGIRVGRVAYHASQPWPFPHSLMLGLYGEANSDEINMDESELEDCRWFTRDEVLLMLRQEHPDGFICPPNRAISSALIAHWSTEA